MSGFIFYLIQIFITEDLSLHCEDNEEGEKSFFAEGSPSINIARRVMSSAGWGKGESPEPANEAGGEKPQLNARSLVF